MGGGVVDREEAQNIWNRPRWVKKFRTFGTDQEHLGLGNGMNHECGADDQVWSRTT